MKLITLRSIDSTNAYTQQLMNQGNVEDGTVVLAYEQSSGKGQRGKSWESLPGMGLYTSILLKAKDVKAHQQFLLNKAITIAVACFIEDRTGFIAKIKWPNDIIVEDAKIAGLLIENSIRGDRISAIIAGIGVNLNHSEFENSFETTATSFKLLTGKSFDPMIEVYELFRQVWNYYQQFLAGEKERIDAEYHHRLYKLGEMTGFIENKEVFFAKLLSVENDGAAIIEREGLKIKAIHPTVRFYLPTIK